METRYRIVQQVRSKRFNPRRKHVSFDRTTVSSSTFQILQRRRQLRGALQEQRSHLSERRRPLGTASDLSEFLHDRRDVFPLRSANLHHEVRIVDVQRRPGLSSPVQQ